MPCGFWWEIRQQSSSVWKAIFLFCFQNVVIGVFWVVVYFWQFEIYYFSVMTLLLTTFWFFGCFESACSFKSLFSGPLCHCFFNIPAQFSFPAPSWHHESLADSWQVPWIFLTLVNAFLFLFLYWITWNYLFSSFLMLLLNLICCGSSLLGFLSMHSVLVSICFSLFMPLYCMSHCQLLFNYYDKMPWLRQLTKESV